MCSYRPLVHKPLAASGKCSFKAKYGVGISNLGSKYELAQMSAEEKKFIDQHPELIAID